MITLAVTRPDQKLSSLGTTTHRVGGVVVGEFGSLKVCRYADEGGVYLLYLDPAGNEVTDTFHDEIDGALAQANFEFGITRDAWLFNS